MALISTTGPVVVTLVNNEPESSMFVYVGDRQHVAEPHIHVSFLGNDPSSKWMDPGSVSSEYSQLIVRTHVIPRLHDITISHNHYDANLPVGV